MRYVPRWVLIGQIGQREREEAVIFQRIGKGPGPKYVLVDMRGAMELHKASIIAGSRLKEVLEEFYGRDAYDHPFYMRHYIRPSGHLVVVYFEDVEAEGPVETRDVWEPVGLFEKYCSWGCRFYDAETGMCRLLKREAPGEACIYFAPRRGERDRA